MADDSAAIELAQPTTVSAIPQSAPKLVRGARFYPAWDRRDPDPKKNYGIHGVELRMYVGGPDGAVQFALFTGWHWLDGTPPLNEPRHAPMPADLGYHSPVERYPDQLQMECEILAALGLGDRCYYDGSGLAAHPVYEALLRGGDEAVWAYLEGYYAEVFR